MELRVMTDSPMHQVRPDPDCGDRLFCSCGEAISHDLQPIVLLPEADAIQALSAHGSCLKQRLDSSVPYLSPCEASE